jgi:hypothetical protein
MSSEPVRERGLVELARAQNGHYIGVERALGVVGIINAAIAASDQEAEYHLDVDPARQVAIRRSRQLYEQLAQAIQQQLLVATARLTQEWKTYVVPPNTTLAVESGVPARDRDEDREPSDEYWPRKPPAKFMPGKPGSGDAVRDPGDPAGPDRKRPSRRRGGEGDAGRAEATA